MNKLLTSSMHYGVLYSLILLLLVWIGFLNLNNKDNNKVVKPRPVPKSQLMSTNELISYMNNEWKAKWNANQVTGGIYEYMTIELVRMNTIEKTDGLKLYQFLKRNAHYRVKDYVLTRTDIMLMSKLSETNYNNISRKDLKIWYDNMRWVESKIAKEMDERIDKILK